MGTGVDKIVDTANASLEERGGGCWIVATAKYNNMGGDTVK